MINEKRSVFFVIVTILFVLAGVFFTSATVVSETKISMQAQDNYRKELEKEYVEGLRKFLAHQGYHNSGVTLTSVTDADGIRTYTATVHHAAIDRITDEKRQELIVMLGELPKTVEDNICHEFLITNP